MKKSETYILIPTVVTEAQISSGAKLLYGIIASFGANNKLCFASNKKLNQMMGGGKTDRTISNYLVELKQIGFLQITRKGNGRTLTALKFVPLRQKSANNPKKGNATNSNLAAEIDLSFVSEDTQHQFQNFIAHCSELGKPITQRMAKALYQSLQRYASEAYLNNRTGQTMVVLRHEIISRAITGGYKNFVPLYRNKMKNEESDNLPKSSDKINSAETKNSVVKRTGVKGGTKLADALLSYKLSIE
jgi:hypothetical protein